MPLDSLGGIFSGHFVKSYHHLPISLNAQILLKCYLQIEIYIRNLMRNSYLGKVGLIPKKKGKTYSEKRNVSMLRFGCIIEYSDFARGAESQCFRKRTSRCDLY